MKTKSDKTSSGKFDYSAMKNVANEHEREGRWAEAAEVWTQIAEQSQNKMIMPRRRIDGNQQFQARRSPRCDFDGVFR